MADSYSKWVMTTAFANNSQAALNSGGKIEWVSLKTSDDAHQVSDLDGFNDTTLATANIKQISGISSVTISGNTVTITGLFNSTNNASDYYIRTIFLVAKYNGKEFLAGTTVANTSGSAFRMPASSDTEITEFTARPQISVTNTNSISTTVDPVASATNERVDSLEATLQGEIDDINVDKQNLWNKLADYVTKAAAETITGVKTFSQTIVGSITGNAGTATKLQTERTIGFSGDVNGTAQGFDGSKNITLPINLNSINQNNTTSTQSAGYNSPVTIIDGITRDTKGRVIGVNTKTVTLPPVQTTISGNAASATKLETARLIGGVYFDGTSDIILPGVNSIGNQNTTGNAATATNADIASKAIALQTPRKINGTAFDGTADINVTASNDSDIVHKSGNETVDGDKTFNGVSTFSKQIRGSFFTPVATFTDFATVASNMNTYAGQWRVGATPVANSPVTGVTYYIVEVIPDITGTAGIIRVAQYGDSGYYYNVVNAGKLTGWHKIAKDETVVHNTGNETIAGSKTFTDYAQFTKLLNAPISIRQVPNGTTKIADLVNSVIGEFGNGAFGSVGYMSFNQSFTDAPNSSAFFLIEIATRGARTYLKIIDADNNYFIGNITSSGLVWSKISNDATVFHLSGDETAAGFKKFSGNIATTSDNSMINGGGNNGDIALVKKSGQSGALVVGQQNSFSVKQSANASILPTDTQTMIFNVNAAGRVLAGTQQDLVPLDKNVAHNSGAETIAGAKRFTEAITADVAINGMLATRTDLPADLNTMNTYSATGVYGVGATNLTNQPVAKFGILQNIVLPSGTTYQKYIDVESGDVYSRAYVSAKGSWSAWDKNADDATVVHNTGNEDIYGDKTFKNKVIPAAIELFSTTPYIDFHFNNDTADYTSRIIETAKGTLSINGVNISGGTISGTLNGNASSSTKLQTQRNINGVSFDGTSDITVDPVTRGIGTAADLFTLSNGFYFNAGVASTNKPSAASNYFVVEVIQVNTNGFMRLIDSNGLSFWTTKSNSTWGSWHQDVDDATVVHNSGNETIGGSKTFSGVATFAKAQTSSTIKKTITTNAPISLNFAETAFGVMVYASASGTFTADSTWKTLATLPTEISAPVQLVTLNDVDWAGIGGVTNRMGVGLKIAIKPNREITYKVTSLKENDNTTYNVGTTFDTSTYWSK